MVAQLKTDSGQENLKNTQFELSAQTEHRLLHTRDSKHKIQLSGLLNTRWNTPTETQKTQEKQCLKLRTGQGTDFPDPAKGTRKSHRQAAFSVLWLPETQTMTARTKDLSHQRRKTRTQQPRTDNRRQTTHRRDNTHNVDQRRQHPTSCKCQDHYLTHAPLGLCLW
jgi:hypothetical protein